MYILDFIEPFVVRRALSNLYKLGKNESTVLYIENFSLDFIHFNMKPPTSERQHGGMAGYGSHTEFQKEQKYVIFQAFHLPNKTKYNVCQ